MNATKRVVVSGMGIMTPIGDNLDDYFTNLIAGKSAISRWKNLDVSSARCKIGGDLSDFGDERYLRDCLLNRMPENAFIKLEMILKTAPLATRLTALTVVQAYVDSGLFNADVDTTRISAMEAAC
jgi:3-oxoacyl-(acyl-carrier-protein) synthase